jgi:hypothetical protein
LPSCNSTSRPQFLEHKGHAVICDDMFIDLRNCIAVF